MLIAQISDLHVGGARYERRLLDLAVAEINEAGPNLLVVAGDLTEDGYPEQHAEAAEALAACEAALRVVIPGNHDARHVGYLWFEEVFGERETRLRTTVGGLDAPWSPSTPPSPTWTRARSGASATAGSPTASPAIRSSASPSATTTWCRSRAPAARRTRSATRATSWRCCAAAGPTSSSAATAMCPGSGRSAGCCSSTPARSRPTGRGPSAIPPTT